MLNPKIQRLRAIDLNFNTLTENREFSEIYKRGKNVVGVYLVLYYKKNEHSNKSAVKADDEVKYGITVSKKIGKAVKRNRAKRLIKESIRLNPKFFSKEYTYVFVARNRINHANFYDVQKNIRYLLSKVK